MGMKLAEKLKGLGVDVVLSYTGHPDAKYANSQSYLIDRLKAEAIAPPVVARQPEATPEPSREFYERRRPLQRLADRLRLRR